MSVPRAVRAACSAAISVAGPPSTGPRLLNDDAPRAVARPHAEAFQVGGQLRSAESGSLHGHHWATFAGCLHGPAGIYGADWISRRDRGRRVSPRCRRPTRRARRCGLWAATRLPRGFPTASRWPRITLSFSSSSSIFSGAIAVAPSAFSSSFVPSRASKNAVSQLAGALLCWAEVAEAVAAQRGQPDVLVAELAVAVPVCVPQIGLPADVGEGMALEQRDAVPLALRAAGDDFEIGGRLAPMDAVVADDQAQVDARAQQVRFAPLGGRRGASCHWP